MRDDERRGGSSVRRECVYAGDTLNMLSARFGRPACMIMRANRLASPAWLTPGRSIIVPAPDFCLRDYGACPRDMCMRPARAGVPRIACIVRANTHVGALAREYGLPERLVLLACGMHSGAILPAGETALPRTPRGARIITVQPWHTLEGICRYSGMDMERFRTLNALRAPLLPGMRVIVAGR